jgi:glycosyltransferase involved in cell wall biosynthesis
MKLSACVITKNEEKTLPMCLQSVKPIVDEIIVVDTGSQDNTVEVAKSFGAQVYHFEWVNDFSKAKNYALSKATGDWIIFLDADEYFTSESIPLIKEVIKDAEAKNCDLIISLMSNFDKTSKQMINSVHHVRIFRRHPEIQYVGAIHERVVRNGMTPRALNAIEHIKIIHTGYSVETVKEKNKSERNLDLLKAELKRNPNSGDIHFYLAESYMANAEFEIALNHAKEAYRLNNFSLMGLNEKNYINMITCMIQLKYTREELIGIIKEAIQKHPTYPDFYFYLGDCYTQDNRLHDALEEYNKGMHYIQNAFVSQSNAPHQAPKILELMGRLYYKTNQVQESVKKFVEALKIDPQYFQALGNLVLLFSKYETMESTAAFLAKLYNFKSAKDLYLLLRASLYARNLELARLFLHQIGKEHEELLEEERAELSFYEGDFLVAVQKFRLLFDKTRKPEYAVRALAAGFLSGDQDTVKKILQSATLSLRVLWDESNAAKIDNTELVLFMKSLIDSGNHEKVFEFVPYLTEMPSKLEVADYLYSLEEYSSAYNVYSAFIMGQYSSNSKMADISMKMGDCLYRLGELSQAAELLEKADTDDYRKYNLLIQIYSDLDDMDSLRKIIEKGINVYPESTYLLAIKHILNS